MSCTYIYVYIFVQCLVVSSRLRTNKSLVSFLFPFHVCTFSIENTKENCRVKLGRQTGEDSWGQGKQAKEVKRIEEPTHLDHSHNSKEIPFLFV